MNKILTISKGIRVAKELRKKNKSIVIAGGFFDIVHLGHIKFLEAAKKFGDYLLVLLEDDSKARKEKGLGRPINPQNNRAEILSSFRDVDYIILLKNMTNNDLYDKLMVEIRPTVIATTYGDPYVAHKKRQARLINAKVAYVTKRIGDHSTTKYTKLIDKK